VNLTGDAIRKVTLLEVKKPGKEKAQGSGENRGAGENQLATR